MTPHREHDDEHRGHDRDEHGPFDEHGDPMPVMTRRRVGDRDAAPVHVHARGDEPLAYPHRRTSDGTRERILKFLPLAMSVVFPFLLWWISSSGWRNVSPSSG